MLEFFLGFFMSYILMSSVISFYNMQIDFKKHILKECEEDIEFYQKYFLKQQKELLG